MSKAERFLSRIIMIATGMSLSALLYANIVYASIGVTPEISEIVVAANAVTKGIYTVVNDGDEPIHVTVEAEDWMKRKTGVSKMPVEKWLAITPASFDVAPKAFKEVTYRIMPPAGSEGELVAMVFFVTAARTGGQADIGLRFGVSIYAAIEGTIRLDAAIKNITVNKNTIILAGGVKKDKGLIFSIDIENTGNVHLRPTGTITVKGRDGKIYMVAVERNFPVYPGMRSNYYVAWDKGDIPPGDYEAEAALDFGAIYNMDKTTTKSFAFKVE